MDGTEPVKPEDSQRLDRAGKSTVFAFRVPSGQRVISKKKQLLDKLSPPAGGWPKSYSRNTNKEETVLEYVEDFRRQFVQVFPTRRPLLLCPMNECGIRKFVCTTVRPTQLPSNATAYNLKDISEFVADFLEYLPLDDPLRLPDILAASATTIRLRAGDCLDFSIFLTSLLRGAGYNAYCVSGYAPKYITLADESDIECPLLANDDDKDKGGDDDADGKGSKYGVYLKPQHQSRFLADRAQEIVDAENKRKADEAEQIRISKLKPRDPLHGDRVHCWVLVKTGRRDVQEDVFVEPSTGTIYPVTRSPYLGIESVWNEVNYWVNVHHTKTPAELSYDLSQTANWEYVLIDERKAEAKDALSADFDSATGESAEPKDLPPEEVFDDRDILDVPMSWTVPVVLEREVIKTRYPTQYRKVVYKKSTLEKWSEYLDSTAGMVQRITIYNDDEMTDVKEIRELFMHRGDHLWQRRTYPSENRIHEMFTPGRVSCLKDYITVEGKSRSFTFHPKARVEGLVRREEQIGVKTMEFFEGRDDFLIYRSISFASSPPLQQQSATAVKPLVVNTRQGELVVRKITEKYARNPAKPAEQDVRKRTHFILDHTIRLDYHYGDQQITHSQEMIDKLKGDSLDDDEQDPYSATRSVDARKNRNFQHRVDPTFKKLTPGQQREENAKLFQKEKDLIAKVKERESLMTDLVKQLELDRQSHVLNKTIYDAAYEQSREDYKTRQDAADDKLDKGSTDYLAPFLAQYQAGKTLTWRQAAQAKDECLNALKERLLDRAKIIQAHLDAESAKLQARQAQYKRQSSAGSSEEANEEFTKFVEEASFRINILHKRLLRHEELALKKYVELDKKLQNDWRLAILNQPEQRQ